MMHCDNCGDAIERDTSGTLVHSPSPPGFDPAYCVMGVSAGMPGGFADAVATACEDPGCDGEGAPPWWADYVKGSEEA